MDIRALFLFFMIYSLPFNLHAADFAVVGQSKSKISIQLSGVIMPGDVYRLRYLFAALGKRFYVKKLFMNSGGGDLSEAIQLGYYINNQRIRTIVGPSQQCKSSCSIAFLGGAQEGNGLAHRTKYSTAILAFHSFYADESVASVEISNLVHQIESQSFSLAAYFRTVDAPIKILREMINYKGVDNFYEVGNAESLEYCIYVHDVEKDKLISPYRLRYAERYSGEAALGANCSEDVRGRK